LKVKSEEKSAKEKEALLRQWRMRKKRSKNGSIVIFTSFLGGKSFQPF